jgi:MSHA biogenesis protein MshJ
VTSGWRQSFNRVLERIDALSLRERAILFVGVLAALFLIASNVAFQSLFAERTRLDRELAGKREQTRALQAQIEQTAAERGRDPNEVNRKRLAELKSQLQQREGALSTVLHGVVSPREMARMVEQVLARNRALTVVSVENLAAVPLADEGSTDAAAGQPAAEGKPAAASGGMYKHGLRIELTGRYPDIMRYLHALETLPWKVFWGEVRLQTENYPMSRVTLVIYTLSLDDAWISV